MRIFLLFSGVFSGAVMGAFEKCDSPCHHFPRKSCAFLKTEFPHDGSSTKDAGSVISKCYFAVIICDSYSKALFGGMGIFSSFIFPCLSASQRGMGFFKNHDSPCFPSHHNIFSMYPQVNGKKSNFFVPM